ncbi:hypothetical protein E2I00_011637, partial [Balaenoptera physalus]
MSYDHYVAICHPLWYSAIMIWRVCNMLVKINHFFCEIMAVLKLACTDTHISETVVLAGMISV